MNRAQVSYNIREAPELTDRAFPLEAATQDGHQTPLPNSTAQSWHTKRPHCWQADTARLPGWSKHAASPANAVSPRAAAASARAAGNSRTVLREPQDVQLAASPFSSSHLGNGILQRAQGTGIRTH
jgi:hypothetical protein